MNLSELKEKCAGHTAGEWHFTSPGYLCGYTRTAQKIAVGYLYNRELAPLCTEEEVEANQVLVEHAPFLLAEATRLSERVKELEGAIRLEIQRSVPDRQVIRAALKETEQ